MTSQIYPIFFYCRRLFYDVAVPQDIQGQESRTLNDFAAGGLILTVTIYRHASEGKNHENPSMWIAMPLIRFELGTSPSSTSQRLPR